MADERTVLIADDHTLVREGLRALLSSGEDLRVVGEAGDGKQAVELSLTLKPDLVLLDLSLPRTSGLDALREIKARCPGTRVLVITADKTEDQVFAALQRGAEGYLSKDAAADELLIAVRSTLAGERYLGASVASLVVPAYLGAKRAAGPSAPAGPLTEREQAVLKLVAEGYRSRQIAEHLNLSVRTVEKHRAGVMRKLDLHTVAALTAYAIERGLVVR